MEIKDYTIITLVIALIVSIALKKCDKDSLYNCEEKIAHIYSQIDTTPDTVHITKIIPIDIDTSAILSANLPKPKVVRDTIWNDTSYTINTFNSYIDSVKDSIQTINYSALVDGTLISLDLDYRIKFSKNVEVEYLEITKPVPYFEKYNQIGIGAIGSINSNFQEISPSLFYKTKDNLMFNYGYGVVHSTHSIGITKMFNIGKPSIKRSK